MSVRFHIIGNPDNRRFHEFQSALRLCDCPSASWTSWRTLLQSRDPFDAGWRHADPETVVRIDSPAEDDVVSRMLIHRGAVRVGLGQTDRRQIADDCNRSDHGEILYPGLWFDGFADVLAQLSHCNVTWMNQPADIAVQFNKGLCQSRLADAGISVPQQLGHCGSYEELRNRMNEAGCSRVFVKLNSSSSGSGVVALEVSRHRVQATTSTEIGSSAGQTRLFNSLRLHRYSDENTVALLVNTLASHGITIERWLPKAGWGNCVFDLRVVMIRGEVRHIVVRTSQSPLTNLHLGNRRGNVRELFQRIPADSLESAFDTCRTVARQFPQSLYCGLDLMFTPGFRHHAILEVNAFGDLLPGVTSQGTGTFSAEILAMNRHVSELTELGITP